MTQQINLFDHGYCELIETWGSDERIIESARMSTNKGFQGWGTSDTPGDEKLLRFLWEHKHATPFEMAGMTIEVQAPIMVFREWHRHRTQSYSELSARYTPMPDVNYLPTIDRCQFVDTKNKQAARLNPPPHDVVVDSWLATLQAVYEQAQRVYQMGLDIGIPKELARLPVPVGRYSRMRASGNLRNWLGFLALRMDKAAQFEIRSYANVVFSFVQVAFPRTAQLFQEGLE